jgi:hypothetical protein
MHAVSKQIDKANVINLILVILFTIRRSVKT